MNRILITDSDGPLVTAAQLAKELAEEVSLHPRGIMSAEPRKVVLLEAGKKKTGTVYHNEHGAYVVDKHGALRTVSVLGVKDDGLHVVIQPRKTRAEKKRAKRMRVR